MKDIAILILLGALVWVLSDPHEVRETYEILMGEHK